MSILTTPEHARGILANIDPVFHFAHGTSDPLHYYYYYYYKMY